MTDQAGSPHLHDFHDHENAAFIHVASELTLILNSTGLLPGREKPPVAPAVATGPSAAQAAE